MKSADVTTVNVIVSAKGISPGSGEVVIAVVLVAVVGTKFGE